MEDPIGALNVDLTAIDCELEIQQNKPVNAEKAQIEVNLIERIRNKKKPIFQLTKRQKIRKMKSVRVVVNPSPQELLSKLQTEFMKVQQQHQQLFPSILNLPKQLHLEEQDASIDNNPSVHNHDVDDLEDVFYQYTGSAFAVEEANGGLFNNKKESECFSEAEFEQYNSLIKQFDKSGDSQQPDIWSHFKFFYQQQQQQQQQPSSQSQQQLQQAVNLLENAQKDIGLASQAGVQSSTTATQSSNSYSRREKSLEELSKKFLTIFLQKESMMISLDKITQQLDVERRRIYDIINILESLKLVTRRGKNNYKWNGFEQIFSTISMFQSQRIVDEIEDNDEDSAVGGHHSHHNKEQNEKKEKSLEILSIGFLKLFLNYKDTLSLEEAARKLSPCNCENQKIKTKIRRLYDIANVFKSLGLIRKVQLNQTKKPAFQWVGMQGLQDFFNQSKEAKHDSPVLNDQYEEEEDIDNEDECTNRVTDAVPIDLLVTPSKTANEQNNQVNEEVIELNQLKQLFLEEAAQLINNSQQSQEPTKTSSSCDHPKVTADEGSICQDQNAQLIAQMMLRTPEPSNRMMDLAGRLSSSKNSAFKKVEKRIFSQDEEYNPLNFPSRYINLLIAPSPLQKEQQQQQSIEIDGSSVLLDSERSDEKKQLNSGFSSKNSAFSMRGGLMNQLSNSKGASLNDSMDIGKEKREDAEIEEQAMAQLSYKRVNNIFAWNENVRQQDTSTQEDKQENEMEVEQDALEKCVELLIAHELMASNNSPVRKNKRITSSRKSVKMAKKNSSPRKDGTNIDQDEQDEDDNIVDEDDAAMWSPSMSKQQGVKKRKPVSEEIISTSVSSTLSSDSKLSQTIHASMIAAAQSSPIDPEAATQPIGDVEMEIVA